MKILEGIAQGSDQWLAIRREHFCASDAPAAMGVSKYKTRSKLLHEKALRTEEEIDPFKQRLFDSGHAAEDAARSVVENILSEELYPSTVTTEVDGLPLLASLDGMTVAGDIIWETKLFNQDLAAAVDAGELDPHYWAQLEHQLLVTGAAKAYFTTSDGTPERTKGMWYVSIPERRAQVIGAWKQFATDIASYQYQEAMPVAVSAPIEDLPALTVELVGQVKNSNLVSFKAAVLARIQAISTDLRTDDDFATADKMVKFLDDGESRLDLVKSQALAQTSTIDELFRTIDALKGEMRAKRLTLANLVKTRKDAIRTEILQEGVAAYAAHIASLNERLGKPYMPNSSIDFAAAMKGKRTISSLREAVNKALLDGKLEASKIADGIAINLRVLDGNAEHRFLFNDEATLVQMDAVGFAAVVESRILKHKQEQQRKEEEARERIRKEEEAKAAAKAKADADKLAEEAREKIRAEEQAKAVEEAKKNPPQSTYIGSAAPKAPTQPRAAPSAPPPRPAPPADEILMLVAERYSVPKTLAEKWLREVFAHVEA